MESKPNPLPIPPPSPSPQPIDVKLPIEEPPASKSRLLIAIIIILFCLIISFSYIYIIIIRPQSFPDQSNQLAPTQQANPSPSPKPSSPTPTPIGESDQISIYLLEARSDATSSSQIGKLLVVNKHTSESYNFPGTYSIFGSTIPYYHEDQGYLLLSNGTYVLRDALPLSLKTQSQLSSNFCHSGEILFYHQYAIYSNCTTFEEIPWGAGEAPGIMARDLTADTDITLFPSTLLKHYHLTSVEKDTLLVNQILVTHTEHWQDPELYQTTPLTYNLSQLP
jgi:hypothetical protein